jgi:hypothetical protein
MEKERIDKERIDKEQMEKERIDNKERIDKEIVRTKCIVCNKSEMCISSICQKCSPSCCSCVNFCNLTPEERANKHKNHLTKDK